MVVCCGCIPCVLGVVDVDPALLLFALHCTSTSVDAFMELQASSMPRAGSFSGVPSTPVTRSPASTRAWRTRGCGPGIPAAAPLAIREDRLRTDDFRVAPGSGRRGRADARLASGRRARPRPASGPRPGLRGSSRASSRPRGPGSPGPGRPNGAGAARDRLADGIDLGRRRAVADDGVAPRGPFPHGPTSTRFICVAATELGSVAPGSAGGNAEKMGVKDGLQVDRWRSGGRNGDSLPAGGWRSLAHAQQCPCQLDELPGQQDDHASGHQQRQRLDPAAGPADFPGKWRGGTGSLATAFRACAHPPGSRAAGTSA